MKYWQLMAVCRIAGSESMPAVKADERAEWREFRVWYDHYERLVNKQDRAKLDFELPKEYVRAVLSDIRLDYYVTKSSDWLCHPRDAPADKELTAVEAYVKYGGDAIETALEKGYARISDGN